MKSLKLMSNYYILEEKKEKGMKSLDWTSMRLRHEQFELNEKFFPPQGHRCRRFFPLHVVLCY